MDRNFYQNFVPMQNSPLPGRGRAGGLRSIDGALGSGGMPKIWRFAYGLFLIGFDGHEN